MYIETHYVDVSVVICLLSSACCGLEFARFTIHNDRRRKRLYHIYGRPPPTSELTSDGAKLQIKIRTAKRFGENFITIKKYEPFLL